jgi:hypothetical protein
MKRMEHRRNEVSILADSFEDLCVVCSLFFVVKFARTTKNSQGLHRNSSGALCGSSSHSIERSTDNVFLMKLTMQNSNELILFIDQLFSIYTCLRNHSRRRPFRGVRSEEVVRVFRPFEVFTL